MSFFRISRRERVLARIAPITEKAGTDRRMRGAVLRAKRKGPLASEFGKQQEFDRAVAGLVREIPVTQEISEWFRNEKLIPRKQRGWKRAIRNPVVYTIALALAVIAGIIAFFVVERMNEFPGSDAARKLLTVAGSMRGVQLDQVDAEAGSLGDLFFMKHRLEHYEVPPEFARLRATAWRVFDDDEGQRVAQIVVAEKRMQFFLFPAERSLQDAKPREFSGWRFIEHEGWTGAVQVRDGVCFMAALRGPQKEIELYLNQADAAGETSGSNR